MSGRSGANKALHLTASSVRSAPASSSSSRLALCGRNERWLVADTQRERRAAYSHQRPSRPNALTAMTPKHAVSEFVYSAESQR